MPFAHFLRTFFRSEKKFGSRDRKTIADLCYSAFRLGKAGLSLPPEERILTGFFLTHDQPSELLGTLRPEWNQLITQGQSEKIQTLANRLDTSGIFPWQDLLSEGIYEPSYSLSFLTQPDLFLRLRPGQEEKAIGKLIKAGIPFERIGTHCLRLSNSVKVEEVLEINKEVVVQDISSQHCLDQDGQAIRIHGNDWKDKIPGTDRVNPAHAGIMAWDACAASGGKSILLWDTLGPVSLTVSDARASILANLSRRFKEAGIGPYEKFVADLSKPVSFDAGKKFDLILADVPCSGSGTWARTPEQLVFFEESRITDYQSLQRMILTNLLPHLHPGGSLIYITCSVFKKENEENMEWAKGKLGLEIRRQKMIKGYTQKGDSLFTATLVLPHRS